jgi:polar amino acid transport system permease protein
MSLEIRPLKHRGRWVSAIVVLFIAGLLLESLLTNQNIGWPTVRNYLFAAVTLKGIIVTIYLTLLAMFLGLAGGVLLAVMRVSENGVLSWIARSFIWFFRGTPVLVQIIFWGYLGALFQNIAIWIPFTHIKLFGWPTNTIITPFLAATLALGLNEMAYAAEIVRGGMIAVDYGQTEAAHSLGFSPTLTFRRIVLPQAMRVIMPPMGNEVITMLKTTALVSVIGGNDLLTVLQRIYSQDYNVIPLLTVGTIWYLILTTSLGIPQAWLERRFGRGSARSVNLPSSLGRLTGIKLRPWIGRRSR